MTNREITADEINAARAAVADGRAVYDFGGKTWATPSPAWMDLVDRLSQAGAGGGVVVRPLEWSETQTHGGEALSARCCDRDWRIYLRGAPTRDRDEWITRQKAKAQAECDDMVLAALAPSPSAGEPYECQTCVGTGLVEDAATSLSLGRGGFKVCPDCAGKPATPPATPVQPTAGGKHIDHKLPPGEYIVRIETEGGAASINGPVQPTASVVGVRLPVEPTDAMLEAGEIGFTRYGGIKGVYRAMVEAATACPSCKGEGCEADWAGDDMRCVAVACSACNGTGRASLTPDPTQGDGKRHWDDIAVDRFAYAMKAKLAQKRAEGYGGWDRKIPLPGLDGRGFYYECPNSFLSEKLREHVEKGDPVDVANFCMMIHQRSEAIADTCGAGTREALEAIVAAWESLPGGRDYPTSAVAEWLKGPMKTALDNARAVLASRPANGSGCGCLTRCSGGCDNPDPEPTPSPAPVSAPAIPRLTDAMIRAACKAFYKTDNIDGVSLAFRGSDHTFRSAFKRMWKAAALASLTPAPTQGDGR